MKVDDKTTLSVVLSYGDPKAFGKELPARIIAYEEILYSYDALFLDEKIEVFVCKAKSIIPVEHLRLIDKLNFCMIVLLKYDGRYSRPSIHLTSKTMKFMTDNFISLDFDPYEI